MMNMGLMPGFGGPPLPPGGPPPLPPGGPPPLVVPDFELEEEESPELLEAQRSKLVAVEIVEKRHKLLTTLGVNQRSFLNYVNKVRRVVVVVFDVEGGLCC